MSRSSSSSSLNGLCGCTTPSASGLPPTAHHTIQHQAASGLLNAMKRKPKHSSSLELKPSTIAAAEELNPSSCTPTLAVVMLAGEEEGLDEENEDSDSSDQNSVSLSSPTERDPKAVQPHRKKRAANGSIDSGSPSSKRVSLEPLYKDFIKPKKPRVVYYSEAARRNKSPKFLFPEERKSLAMLVKKPWLHDPKPQVQVSGAHYGLAGQSFYFPSPLSQVVINDEMPVEERKRFFIYTPTEAMQEAMQMHVSNIHKLFPPTRHINDCMLHPNPGGLRKNGKYHQVIACTYQWKDECGIHTLGVNFGIVALIVNYHLTVTQKEGFIEEAWHLSHLCGNWICCNWRHHTVEPGPVNIGRNACFSSVDPCTHNPRCMKDKKVALNLPTLPATPSRILAASNLSMDIAAEEEKARKREEEEEKEKRLRELEQQQKEEEELEEEVDEEKEEEEDDSDEESVTEGSSDEKDEDGD